MGKIGLCMALLLAALAGCELGDNEIAGPDAAPPVSDRARPWVSGVVEPPIAPDGGT